MQFIQILFTTILVHIGTSPIVLPLSETNHAIHILSTALSLLFLCSIIYFLWYFLGSNQKIRA